MDDSSAVALTCSESLVETIVEDHQSSPEVNFMRDHATSDVPVLRRAAMDFLARREHSFRELTRKMQLKFPDSKPEAIEAVLDVLRAEKLQSDERFAESWVRYRQSRGFGYLHILADLKERGISASVIDRHLFSDDDVWIESVHNLIGKRLGTAQKIACGSEDHQKLMRYLQSRGFAASEINKALQSGFGLWPP